MTRDQAFLIVIVIFAVVLGPYFLWYQIRRKRISNIAKKFGLDYIDDPTNIFVNYDKLPKLKGRIFPGLPADTVPANLKSRMIKGTLNGHTIEIYDNYDRYFRSFALTTVGMVGSKRSTIITIDGHVKKYRSPIIGFIKPADIEDILAKYVLK